MLSKFVGIVTALLTFSIAISGGTLIAYNLTQSSQENNFTAKVDFAEGTNHYKLVEIDEGDNNEEKSVTNILHEFLFSATGESDSFAWDFGDGVTSNLKSPTRSYQGIGSYNATLRIMDQGSTWSETDVTVINVSDDTVPVPVITVNNVVIEDNISILTNQMIQFSASRTVDNAPIQNLDFQWEWGDGDFDDGLGNTYSQHNYLLKCKNFHKDF